MNDPQPLADADKPLRDQLIEAMRTRIAQPGQLLDDTTAWLVMDCADAAVAVMQPILDRLRQQNSDPAEGHAPAATMPRGTPCVCGGIAPAHNQQAVEHRPMQGWAGICGDDGPTMQEAAADDRRWDLEKTGE